MSPRNFAILALATAASIALAVYAVVQRDMPLRVEAAGGALFPGLLDHLNEIRELRITTSAGKLTVKVRDQGWVLSEKADYPVAPSKVRDVALALANLQLLETKTADPQRLGRLELDEPSRDGAKSRLVELLGGDAAPLAAAVVGKASPSLYGGGRGGIYVRRAGDNQAWLAAGELDLPTDAISLIGGELIDVPADQVARVVLQPPGEPDSRLSRPDASSDFVTDAKLPEGRHLDPVKVETLSGALSGLSMTDVRPASEMPIGPDARHVRFETFAGGAVDVSSIVMGEGETAEHWISVKLTGEIGGPTATGKSANQAAELARKLDDWVFKVPAYHTEQLGVGLDQLMAEPTPAS